MDSDDEFIFSEPVQRKRTNLTLSDLEEEVSATVVLAGSSTSADVPTNVPTTSTVTDTTQQQHGQIVLIRATTTPKSNKGGKKQQKKRRRTDADNAYSMNFSDLSFFHWMRNILHTICIIIIYIFWMPIPHNH